MAGLPMIIAADGPLGVQKVPGLIPRTCRISSFPVHPELAVYAHSLYIQNLLAIPIPRTQFFPPATSDLTLRTSWKSSGVASRRKNNQHRYVFTVAIPHRRQDVRMTSLFVYLRPAPSGQRAEARRESPQHGRSSVQMITGCT